MDNIYNIIVTCFVAPAIYELLKHLLLLVKNKLQESNVEYTISGYWGAIHSDKDKNGKEHTAYELLKISQEGNKLFSKLYQLTNDERFYTYNCVGYIKGQKVSLAYSELNNQFSNDTGTINLLRYEKFQHTPNFMGVYSEFSKSDTVCTSKEYNLIPVKLNLKERILLILLKSRYAKIYLKKESFKNALYMQKMW